MSDDLLSRLSTFLPAMAAANASLQSYCPKIDDNLILDVKKDGEEDGEEEGGEGNASNTEEDDAGMIVMNVALGDFDGSVIANAEEKEIDEEKGSDGKEKKEITWIKPKEVDEEEVDDEDDFKNLEVQLKLNPKLYDKIFKMRKI